ncbi:WD40 repeat domain-containing protein [Streptomyces sp. NPDC050856]|uniref:WD40 repeat domain-containing protein n=1 Tax=Streptomyces sp. NPDC050856 TaxID=3154939 RepID=UPI0033F5CAAD
MTGTETPGTPGGSGTPGPSTGAEPYRDPYGEPYGECDGSREEERAVHAAVTAALAGLAGATPDTPPPPYVRRHLAQHARLGGVLDDDHVPRGLLPWDTSGGVRGLLAAQDGHGPRAWLDAWAVIEPYVRGADARSRLSSLHLTHAALTYPRVPAARVPADATPPGSRLTVLWSWWRPPANVLATVAHRVTSLAAVRTGPGGTLLATGDEEGGIELIDVSTGTPVGDRIAAHEGTVRCLTGVHRPAGGSRLVSGSTDGTVRIWDTATGSCVDRIARPGTVWTDDVTGHLADDGSLTVVSVNGEGALTHWTDSGGARALPALEPVSKAAVTTVTGRDGEHLLVTAATTLSVRDPETGAVHRSWPLTTTVRALTALAPAGTFASGHDDGTVTVWDTTGGPRAAHRLPEPVTCLAALTIAGRPALAAAAGRAIALWDVEDREAPARWLTGHTGTVTALTSVPAGGRDALVSAGADNTVRLWDHRALTAALPGPGHPPAPRPTPPPTAPAPATDTGTGADPHPEADPAAARARPRAGAGPGAVAAVTAAALATGDGGPPLLAVGTADTGLELRDIDGGGHAGSLPTDGHAVTALAWATRGRGRLLLWAGPDHTIRCWDATTGTHLPAVLEGHHLPVRALAACTTHQGRSVALSGGDDYRVRLWDLDEPALLRDWRGHDLRIRAVAAAAGHRRDWLASAGSDGTVRLWDIEGGPAGRPIRCRQGLVNAIAVNARPADGLPPHLASAGDDGTVRLWDLLTGRPLGAPLTGHTASVDAVAAWSTEGLGSFVASASRDGTVRVWEAVSGRCALQLATAAPVHTLSAHPAASGGGPAVVLTMAGDAGVVVTELDLTDM